MRKILPYMGASLAALAMAWSAPSKAQDNPKPFEDVKPTHWAYDAVTDLQKKGIVKGYPDGFFMGKRVLTRYEFAVALERALQSLPPGGNGTAGPAGETGPAGVAGAEGPAGPPGMTPEEVQNLMRLTDQFKNELASLGMNIGKIQSRLDDLAKQVDAINRRLDRMIHFNGDFFFMARTDRSRKVFEDYSGAGRLGGHFLNMSTPSDFHLEAHANLPGGVHFTGDLVSSNYLSYRGGTLSAGAVALPNQLLNQETSLYEANLLIPVGGPASKTTLQVGRYRQQVTPLTMYRPDLDAYADTPWYDDGNYIQDGAKLQTKFGSATTSLWAGSTSSVVLGTMGSMFNAPIVGANFGSDALTTAKPSGLLGFARGGIVSNQNVGIHVGLPLGRFGELGITAIDFTQSGGIFTPPIVGTKFEDVVVYGANLKLNPIGRFLFSAEAAKSVTQLGFTKGDGQSNDDNNAFLLNAGYNSGPATIQAGYQYYDPRFAAPGYWNKIGNWYNPTNVQGPFVRLGWKFSNLLQGYIGADYLSGARNRAFAGGGGFTPGSSITRGTVGVKFHVNRMVDLNAAYEGVIYDLSGAVSASGVRSQPVEQYITLGAGLNLSGNTVLKLAYQILSYQNGGSANGGFGGFSALDGGHSNAGVFTTQLGVHF